jgi:hypothetical protein
MIRTASACRIDVMTSMLDSCDSFGPYDHEFDDDFIDKDFKIKELYSSKIGCLHY